MPVNKMKTYLFLLLSLALFVGSAHAQETIGGDIILGEVNITRFPEVSVPVVFGNENGRSQTTLPTPDQYSLSEDGQPIEQFAFTPSEDAAPQSIFIVIDQGLYSVGRYRENYNEQALKEMFLLLNNGYRPGIDTITMLAGRNDQTTNLHYRSDLILDTTTSNTELENTLRTFDLTLRQSNIPFDSIQPLETPNILLDALDHAQKMPNPVIIYMSASIHAPNEDSEALNRADAAVNRIAKEANKIGARFYVLQTAAHLADDPLRAPMKKLAEVTGGGYLELLTNRNNEDDVTALYSTIWQPGGVFTLTYRSQSGSAEERPLILTARNNPNQTAETRYQVALINPTIAVTAPTEGVALERNSSPVRFTLDVTWPDKMARNIQEVQVNGSPVPNFEFDGSQVTFVYGLNPGESLEHLPIEVTVLDELGLTAVSNHTLTIAPSSAPVEPSTQPPNAAPEPAQPLTCNSWCIATIAIVGITLVTFFLLRRFSPTAATAKRQVRKIIERAATITPFTNQRQKEVLATLEVLVGRQDLIGQTIDLFNEITTLGRDYDLSDIQIFDQNERSSVSGQHCTIQYDKGKFWLTDNGSANGTTVNGRLLTPDLAHELNDKDEIVLGDRARRGAQLRFHITAAARNVTVTDRDFAEQYPSRTGKETEIGPRHSTKESWLDLLEKH